MKSFFKNKFRSILACVFAAIFLISGGLLLAELFSGKSTEKTLSRFVNSIEETEEKELPENPVDFAVLQETNADVCAWIKIPETRIDYPILQSSDGDDSYYLTHNMYHEYEKVGSIFIESLNSNTFTDPNTVIYGHNTVNGTMFRDLHNFRDKEYFDARTTMYVYTPGHILTYTIFACHRYDNRHILKSFDFSDKTVFAEYLKDSLNPKSVIANVRPVEISVDDRIITLSTCIDRKHNYRLLLQGVLISDVETK
ncbi:MAG: class B sortase [Clostridia bacterium]|nr:class B sortase [Clostridia bacterium]